MGYAAVAAIDMAHADLLHGLVRAQKPRDVLEFGFGTGLSTRAILTGLKENCAEFCYLIVDNWADFGGELPAHGRHLQEDVNFVQIDEQAFVEGCQSSFDFIFSDADHRHTDLWFQRVYDALLKPGGILCYHDVTNPEFPNLEMILRTCESQGLTYMLFNRISQPGENCERGLLVIHKPGVGHV